MFIIAEHFWKTRLVSGDSFNLSYLSQQMGDFAKGLVIEWNYIYHSICAHDIQIILDSCKCSEYPVRIPVISLKRRKNDV